jgi:hypothetical protein
MNDPTDIVTTLGQARMLARALLRCAPEPVEEFWHDICEPILMVLLYQASPTQTGAGLAGVEESLTALAGDHGDAAHRVGVRHPTDRQWFSRIDSMSPEARHVVVTAMREAVCPWLVAWA